MDKLICDKCKSKMDWLPVTSAVLPKQGETLVIARCPKCGHEISIEPVEPDFDEEDEPDYIHRPDGW